MPLKSYILYESISAVNDIVALDLALVVENLEPLQDS